MGFEKLTAEEMKFLETERKQLLPGVKLMQYLWGFFFLFLSWRDYSVYELAIRSGKSLNWSTGQAFNSVIGILTVLAFFMFLAPFTNRHFAKKYLAIIDKLAK